jgi:hypothetical protein
MNRTSVRILAIDATMSPDWKAATATLTAARDDWVDPDQPASLVRLFQEIIEQPWLHDVRSWAYAGARFYLFIAAPYEESHAMYVLWEIEHTGALEAAGFEQLPSWDQVYFDTNNDPIEYTAEFPRQS